MIKHISFNLVLFLSHDLATVPTVSLGENLNAMLCKRHLRAGRKGKHERVDC